MEILISDEIHAACPGFVGAAVEAEVASLPTPPELLREIETESQRLRASLTPEDIKRLPAVSATREAYRRCGKDPSRYRPSGEQLIRRVVQGKALYSIGALVDLLNLASLASGYSIGGFDLDAVDGPRLTLGIGREGEPYEGIGRGPLNIAGMPVYRDASGGVGTPTSDNQRTRLTPQTRRLLAIVNGYDGNEAALLATAERIRNLLRRYARSDGGSVRLFRHAAPSAG